MFPSHLGRGERRPYLLVLIRILRADGERPLIAKPSADYNDTMNPTFLSKEQP